PLNLWRFYNDRAGIELLIKQLKGTMLSAAFAPLLRERDILPFASACLQPRQLVQAPLLARPLTERDPSDLASPYPFDAGPTASHRQPAAFGFARKRSPRGGLETCAPPNQQTQTVQPRFHAGFRFNSLLRVFSLGFRLPFVGSPCPEWPS